MVLAAGLVYPTEVMASHDDGGEGSVSVYLEPLPQALWKTAAISVSSDEAYIFGGLTNTGTIVNTIVRFNLDPDASTLMDTLPTALHSASAVWTGTYAYIFGGTTSSGS
jgi:hypothetical protein